LKRKLNCEKRRKKKRKLTVFQFSGHGEFQSEVLLHWASENVILERSSRTEASKFEKITPRKRKEKKSIQNDGLGCNKARSGKIGFAIFSEEPKNKAK